MTIIVCEKCSHKIFSVLYSPKFCRECGAQDLKTVSLTEWIIFGFVILSVVVLFSGCGQDQNPNAQNSQSATPSPTESQLEKENAVKEEDRQIKEAIRQFVSENYKDWQIKGIADGLLDCGAHSEDPCNLHLIKGNKNKIVPVIIKQFTGNNGEKYWFVFEARPIDISREKINKIKEEAASYENCADVVRDVENDLRERNLSSRYNDR